MAWKRQCHFIRTQKWRIFFFFFVPFVEYACIYKLFSACSFGFHFLGSEIPSSFYNVMVIMPAFSQAHELLPIHRTLFFFHISELLRKTTLFLLLLKTRYWKLLGKKKHMYIYLKTKKEIEKSIHLEIFFFRVENWGIKIVALNSAVLNSLKTDKDEIITIKFVQDTVSSLVSVNASRFLGKASLLGEPVASNNVSENLPGRKMLTTRASTSRFVIPYLAAGTLVSKDA